MNCTLPGAMNSLGYEMCRHRGMSPPENVLNRSNESLGLYNLITGFQGHYTDMLAPPIGAGMEEGDCLARCESYCYRIIGEDFTYYLDDDMQRNDFFAYFPSLELEQWTEVDSYTGGSLVSDIGGALGLLLGSSLASLVVNGMQMLGLGAKLAMR